MKFGKGTKALSDQDLEKIIGGYSEALHTCKDHDWIFTGYHTDPGRQATWNFYKCSRCGQEKKERNA